MEEPRDPTGYYKLGQEMEGSWIMIRKRNGMKIGKCKKDFGKIRESLLPIKIPPHTSCDSLPNFTATARTCAWLVGAAVVN